MSARDQILNNVTANKPSLITLPDISIHKKIDRSLLAEQFMMMLSKIGGIAVAPATIELVKQNIAQSKNDGEHVVDMIGQSDTDGLSEKDAASLESIDRAFIEGEIGVAENGAVWLFESKMVNRLLPFICQHLVIVLRLENIVTDMHEAYQRINTAAEGYGVFIAGPSKTADIEQSLVIGAHGARSLLVYLV